MINDFIQGEVKDVNLLQQRGVWAVLSRGGGKKKKEGKRGCEDRREGEDGPDDPGKRKGDAVRRFKMHGDYSKTESEKVQKKKSMTPRGKIKRSHC